VFLDHFLDIADGLTPLFAFGAVLTGGELAIRTGGWLSVAKMTLWFAVELLLGGFDFICNPLCDKSHEL
jgi:hypothetical protein